jgi:hypothetical protein
MSCVLVFIVSIDVVVVLLVWGCPYPAFISKPAGV